MTLRTAHLHNWRFRSAEYWTIPCAMQIGLSINYKEHVRFPFEVQIFKSKENISANEEYSSLEKKTIGKIQTARQQLRPTRRIVGTMLNIHSVCLIHTCWFSGRGTHPLLQSGWGLLKLDPAYGYKRSQSDTNSCHGVFVREYDLYIMSM